MLHFNSNYFIVSGKSSNLSSTPRAGHLLRPTSPKSPGASASAFESIEGSDDEENMTDTAKLDSAYLHTNGNGVSIGDYGKCLVRSILHFSLPVINMKVVQMFVLCIL